MIDPSKDTPLHEQIIDILGAPEVDCAVNAVGFASRGHGHEGAKHEARATVLNSLMQVTRVTGNIGIPGLYVTGYTVDLTGGFSDVVVHGHNFTV
ncbi:hypothetical protein PAGU2196_17510 [Pseudomonas sp. PAGU 2196]|nr:hypothetical protein PAGU2196_17510 [Pseudomonas sp. PAGU 2196]